MLANISLKNSKHKNLFARLREDKSRFDEFFAEFADVVPARLLKEGFAVIELIEGVLTVDEDFMKIYFPRFAVKGSRLFEENHPLPFMLALLTMRGDIKHKKQIMTAFHKSLPVSMTQNYKSLEALFKDAEKECVIM